MIARGYGAEASAASRRLSAVHPPSVGRSVVRHVCAACVILLLFFGVTPHRLHAQRLGLSVEVSGGWSAVRSNGITDPGIPTTLAYADHWLGQQASAPSGEARVVVELPFGLGAFVGYHVTEFRQVADSTLQENLYGRWLYSWSDVNRFTGSSRTEGMELGLTYTPALHWTPLKPFVSVGIRQERLRSGTVLEAKATEVAAVTSRSTMTTGTDWGPRSRVASCCRWAASLSRSASNTAKPPRRSLHGTGRRRSFAPMEVVHQTIPGGVLSRQVLDTTAVAR